MTTETTMCVEMTLEEQLINDQEYQNEVAARCEELKAEIAKFQLEINQHEVNVATEAGAWREKEKNGTADAHKYLEYMGGEILLNLRRAELARLHAELVEAHLRDMLERFWEDGGKYMYPVSTKWQPWPVSLEQELEQNPLPLEPVSLEDVGI